MIGKILLYGLAGTVLVLALPTIALIVCVGFILYVALRRSTT